MSIYFEKARELAQLILDSAEAKKLKIATEKLTSDESIMRMLDDFEAYRERVAADIESHELTKEEQDAMLRELARMLERIDSQSLVIERKKALEEYEGLVNGVSDILNMTLGRNESKCAGCDKGCAGGCA